METAIQQLFTKNETILAECEKLKQANERLQAENAELQQRLQVSALINIIRIVSLFYIWFGNITMRLMTVTVAQKYRVRYSRCRPRRPHRIPFKREKNTIFVLRLEGFNEVI